MADFGKRGFGCDDECGDGEGGERGERGKRGKRGPRGHDGRDGGMGATGPTGSSLGGGPIVTDPSPPTLRGDGTPENPLQVINVAPQPFTSETRFVFANAGGSDETGDGSEGNPFQTFQFAVLQVPLFIPSGVTYVIDITNLGDEQLPEDYELPSWVSADFIFNGPGVVIFAGMNPVEGTTPFTPTGATRNPFSGTFTYDDPSQSFGDLKGKFVQSGDPGDPQFAVIHENTATELQLTGNEFFFGELQIVEPSARLFGNFLISCHAFINIVGVAIEDGVTVADTQCIMDHCTVKFGYFAAPVYRQYTFSCDLISCGWGGQCYIASCFVRETSGEAFEPSPPYIFLRDGTVMENISTIAGVHLGPDDKFGPDLLIDGLLIKNVFGHGFELFGGIGKIRNVDINNCDGNAFYFRGPGKWTLSNVGGSGNAGVGLRVDDGAQVEATEKEGTGTSLEVFEDPEFGVIVVLSSPGANFSGGASIEISGATSAGNNGTFPVLGVIDPDTIAFFNPNGVEDLAFAGNFVLDPVTVTGSNPGVNDQEVGNLGPCAYPPPPYNINDIGVPGTCMGGATGTNARLFNK